MFQKRPLTAAVFVAAVSAAIADWAAAKTIAACTAAVKGLF